MITNIKDFKNKLNESNNLKPFELLELEKMLGMMSELDDEFTNVWFFDLPGQMVFNNNKDGKYGKYGFQLADEDANPLYYGLDPKVAFETIKKYM